MIGLVVSAAGITMLGAGVVDGAAWARPAIKGALVVFLIGFVVQRLPRHKAT